MTALVARRPTPADTGAGTAIQALADVYRPVQYLGSKVRALPDLVAACAQYSRGGRVWDAFTGSSVVAQALSLNGLDVLATDTQLAATTFAQALLGVGRKPGDGTQLVRLADSLRESVFRLEQKRFQQLHEWVDREDQALAEHDPDRLRAVYESIPQRGNTGASRGTVPNWLADSELPISTTFAGTYFGIRQARDLDAIRLAIDLVGGHSDSWLRASLLTALCRAASAASHSAGKHFAQPLGDATRNRAFRDRRLLQDRAVGVWQVFAQSVLKQADRPACGSNDASMEFDVINAGPDWIKRFDIDVLYADPPYTAQQYSRFYHALDTLVIGRSQALQRVNGRPTRGLYPESRYMSPFCSKKLAPCAFQRLLHSAHIAGASTVLSYSLARSASKNDRMIALDDLLACAGRIYGSGRVHVQELAFHYRDFNATVTMAPERRTSEVLVVAERQL